MAKIDPDDDTLDRWIVWWYQYDESRRERRNMVVAAFDNEAEFLERIGEADAELQRLQAEDRAEGTERISGGLHRAGSGAETRARRASSRAFLTSSRVARREGPGSEGPPKGEGPVREGP
jgi:hypothetical protein